MSDLISRRNLIKETDNFSQGNDDSSQGLVKDLISRQEAIDGVEDADLYHQNKNGEMVRGANPSDHQAWYKAEDIYNVLESLPSAEPKIIRCKDCKHHDGIRCFRWNSTIITGFDDFCSNAEKRGEEE